VRFAFFSPPLVVAEAVLERRLTDRSLCISLPYHTHLSMIDSPNTPIGPPNHTSTYTHAQNTEARVRRELRRCCPWSKLTTAALTAAAAAANDTLAQEAVDLEMMIRKCISIYTLRQTIHRYVASKHMTHIPPNTPQVSTQGGSSTRTTTSSSTRAPAPWRHSLPWAGTRSGRTRGPWRRRRRTRGRRRRLVN
jgi:hypothetical protein